jgi:hypothetical protein
MKKTISILLILIISVALISCSKEPTVETTQAQSTIQETPEPVPVETAAPEIAETPEEPQEEPPAEEEPLGDVYFKDKTLVLKEITLEITDIVLIKPGDVDYLDEPQLTFFFTLTNTSDRNLPVNLVWLELVSAKQETDSTIETLDVGMTYYGDEKYGELSENLGVELKPGGKIDALMPYELKYPDLPVTLTFIQSATGKEIGKLVVDPIE